MSTIVTDYPRTFYVDVDRTLVNGERLNERLVRELRALPKNVDLVLWSAQGREYAEKVAADHNITDLFYVIVGKPNCIYDDEGWGWNRMTKIVRRIF